MITKTTWPDGQVVFIFPASLGLGLLQMCTQALLTKPVFISLMGERWKSWLKEDVYRDGGRPGWVFIADPGKERRMILQVTGAGCLMLLPAFILY